MANNIAVKDAAAATQTVKTTDNAGVHTPHNNVDAVIPGVAATSLGKAEDAAHVTGDTGVAVLAVRRDAAAVGTDLDGDYSLIGVDASGRVWVHDPQAVTALQIMDDWDEADRAKVNPIVGQAGVAAGAGAVGVTTQRTTLASDDPAVVALQIIDDWDETDRAKVNLIPGQAGITAGAGAVAANTPRVTHASDDPVTAALQIIDDWDETDRAKVNPIAGQAGVQGGSGVVTALTQRTVLATDVPLPAGTNALGKVGLDPQTAGGLTISRTISAASTNATSAKASAGQVFGWYLSNINAAARYLKLYNKASAPTVGTDTPVMTIMIPPGGGANVEFTNGIAFGTGIAYAITTGATDADTGAVAANEIIVNLLYK